MKQVLTQDGVTLVATGGIGGTIKVFRPRLFPGESAKDVTFAIKSTDGTETKTITVHCPAVPNTL